MVKGKVIFEDEEKAAINYPCFEHNSIRTITKRESKKDDKSTLIKLIQHKR